MMKKVLKLTLVLLWMALIFSFSAQRAEESSEVSNGVIVKIASVFVSSELTPAEQHALIEKYSFAIRKTAHFSVYLILGVLLLNFLMEFKLKHILIIAVVICCLYSISDEYHQTFVEGRSGEVRDVCIDTSGAMLGIAGFYQLRKNMEKRKR